MSAGWEFWIDRGGTFTDIVARAPGGELTVRKLLSENPGRYVDAATEGVRLILAEAGTPDAPVAAVKMGTTVATNALLERKGEPTVLAITAGLGDALRIGWQSRPRIFDRQIVLPEPLYGAVVEIPERVTAEGEVLESLNETATRAGLQAAFDDGFRAVAIVLMHGWRFTAHEAAVAAIARAIGFTQVSVSHEVAPLIKLVGRGDTAVVDAYLSPVLRRYVDRVSEALGDSGHLLFMQSNGGLTDARGLRGKDAVLSGPAGGIVGMAATAQQAGFQRVIGFDMGGTSTDVSHYAGTYERSYETVVAGVRLRAPMMDIHTVAAGGGSICSFDGARLRVGPHSAGAVPGPACYRRGGPLTITDCNVMLGKVRPELFPAVFGPGGDEPLDAAAVAERFAGVAAAVKAATGREVTGPELAEGFVTVAVENMARAIKQISIQRGYDLGRYVLACFGGAGGQHACLVADALGMTRVMIHPLAGVLSAYGMGLADLRVVREETVEQPLQGGADFAAVADRLEAAGRAALEAQDVPVVAVEAQRRAQVKYAGTDAALEVELGTPDAVQAAFEESHRRRFGFIAADKPLVVEALSVEVVGKPAGSVVSATASGAGDPEKGVVAPEPTPVPVRMARQDLKAPVFARDGLRRGSETPGPAIITEATATTVVEPGWTAKVDDYDNLILTRTTPLPRRRAAGTDADPVLLEVFNSRFMAVAEQMGQALQNTAYSVNIKERLDFSCALFDAGGGLIANAPHIPVHLGSMGESIRAVVRSRGGKRDGRGMLPGDAYMLNAPYNGGTHLPDITVITPVFLDDPTEPAFYVAARGHHADIGGITPGSMPPDSKTVMEEGVLIDDFLLIDEGRLCEAETRTLLASGDWPARNIDQNLADLKAQAAACVRGAEELTRMVDEFGREVVEAYMTHVQANAEEQVRRVIGKLTDGEFACETDGGAAVKVAIRVNREARSAVIDFTGTSAQLDSNFNAPLSITRAAVLYVFRTLVDDEIPLNEGCLKPIEIIVPDGSMLNPHFPAAVVAGNVETSQVVVDALYGALGALAGSQGTMNNFTFGDATRQYYETIAGGAGAGPGFDGASAVQTHMTNSRLTDPEVLETRFPVLLEAFSIRHGSGGAGAGQGGDGVVRRVRFLEPMTAAILSNRRRVSPRGLEDGEDGKLGENRVERADGSVEILTATDQRQMAAGDVFVIETPGGGGFGRA